MYRQTQLKILYIIYILIFTEHNTTDSLYINMQTLKGL